MCMNCHTLEGCRHSLDYMAENVSSEDHVNANLLLLKMDDRKNHASSFCRSFPAVTHAKESVETLWKVSDWTQLCY